MLRGYIETDGSIFKRKKLNLEDNKMRKIVLLCAAGMSTSMLVTKMKKYADDQTGQAVFISHGNAADDAQIVADLVQKEFHVKAVTVNFIGPIVGSHSGPGTIALFFVGDKEKI